MCSKAGSKFCSTLPSYLEFSFAETQFLVLDLSKYLAQNHSNLTYVALLVLQLLVLHMTLEHSLNVVQQKHQLAT